jgi:AraC-like DNA-binding protein
MGPVGRVSSSGSNGIEGVLRRCADQSERYREFAPPPDLQAFVACTWFKVLGRHRDDALVPIIPDGCSDIMTYDDGAPFVVGPDPVTRWATLRDGLVITGLRMRPGALRAVLGQRADELLGESALLADLQRSATGLQHALDGADGLARRLGALEAWVRARLHAAAPRDHALVAACRTVADRPRVAIERIADGLGWNVRTLHRELVAACGYGPKYLQRVMRVQRLLRAVHAAGPAPRLGELALVAGFADQAHMSRDFRSLTGFTPTAYLGQADAEVGRWIDGDPLPVHG